MMECCICDEPGEVCTPFIDDDAYTLCRQHFNLYLTVDRYEDIGMWAWCRHMTSWAVVDGTRMIGRTWFCDWMDSLYAFD